MLNKAVFVAALFFSIILAGCSSEMKIDGTNTETLKQSWMQMYDETPENERENFVRGSAYLIFEAAGPVLFENSTFSDWGTIAVTQFVTSPNIVRDARPYIVEEFDGKSRADIISLSNSYSISEDIPQNRLEIMVDRIIL